MAQKVKGNGYMLLVKEAAISYADSAAALMTIPDGAKIQGISIVVTTGFDGTTPTYDVGYASDADEIVDGVTLLSTAGSTTATAPAATAAKWANGITSGKIVGTFVGGGSNAAGAGKIRIAYYV